MEFNKLVKTRLLPVLDKYGLELEEEYKDILRLKSAFIELLLVYNALEKTCYLSIGKRNGEVHELRNNAMKDLFNSSLSVERVTPDIFVQNLSVFFNTQQGAQLLEGNLDEFIEYKIAEDRRYNSELLLSQDLAAASKAWESKDYAAFISILEKIGVGNLPNSYQLKYKIAKQKVTT